MTRRKSLLHKLLEALVDEWGADEVGNALARISSTPFRSSFDFEAKRGAPNRSSSLPSATTLVEQAEVQDEKKRPLLLLANRFDKKEFLPSVADVREFVIMTGERPRALKNRADAFRLILPLLKRFSSERLQQIAEQTSHSGPTQLGPISDAISAVGERLPRRLHETEPKR